jgi:hypothetical protein
MTYYKKEFAAKTRLYCKCCRKMVDEINTQCNCKVSCSACNGSGEATNEDGLCDCPRCGGSGERRYSHVIA